MAAPAPSDITSYLSSYNDWQSTSKPEDGTYQNGENGPLVSDGEGGWRPYVNPYGAQPTLGNGWNQYAINGGPFGNATGAVFAHPDLAPNVYGDQGQILSGIPYDSLAQGQANTLQEQRGRAASQGNGFRMDSLALPLMGLAFGGMGVSAFGGADSLFSNMFGSGAPQQLSSLADYGMAAESTDAAMGAGMETNPGAPFDVNADLDKAFVPPTGQNIFGSPLGTPTGVPPSTNPGGGGGGGSSEGGGGGGPTSEAQSRAPVESRSAVPNSFASMLANGSSPQALIASLFGGGSGASGFLNASGGPGGVGAMPWGSPGNLMSLGTSAYGLYQSQQLKKLAQMGMGNAQGMAASADPWGSSGGRTEASTQLSGLMKDPSSITKMPGYEAGLQAVQRSMAAQGYNGSGNMMAALSKYGGDFYNNAISQLGGLSGVGNAGVAGSIANQGQQIGMAGNVGAMNGATNALSLLAKTMQAGGPF